MGPPLVCTAARVRRDKSSGFSRSLSWCHGITRLMFAISPAIPELDQPNQKTKAISNVQYHKGHWKQWQQPPATPPCCLQRGRQVGNHVGACHQQEDPFPNSEERCL